jgi:SAM-dependent methyltransferase
MKRCLLLLLLLPACQAPKEKPPSPAFDRYRRPDLVVAALGLRRGARVADIGAGRGYLEPRLVAAVGATGHVVATDIDGAALEALRAASPEVETRRVAADDPGLGAETYDLILLSEVDHYLPDRESYLRRLARNLAPGGRIAVCNRRPFRAPVLAAAARAGLAVVGEYDGLPAHFLIFLGDAR